jgi:hypothetical protein
MPMKGQLNKIVSSNTEVRYGEKAVGKSGATNRLVRKLCIGGAVTSMLTVAMVTGAAPAANAAEGGCNTNSQGSWNVGVCSSDNGVRVFGDVYINRRGSLGSRCTVSYELEDLSTDRIVARSGNQSCFLGRHPAISAPKQPGHAYINTARVKVNNRVVWLYTSKTVF